MYIISYFWDFTIFLSSNLHRKWHLFL